MSLITVEGIRVYAYHGHLAEEATLGGHFIINVWVETDTSQVEVSDNLKDTVDYVKLIEIVKNQMEIRADMIEVPAKRIVDAIAKTGKPVEGFSIEGVGDIDTIAKVSKKAQDYAIFR